MPNYMPSHAEITRRNIETSAGMFSDLTTTMVSHRIQYTFGQLATLVRTPSALVEGLEREGRAGTLQFDEAGFEVLKTLAQKSGNDWEIFQALVREDRQLGLTSVRAAPRPH